jgi:hypothetical protein
VQEVACDAIWVLAYNNHAIRVEAGRLELLADLQAAIRRHASSVKVQEAACGVTYNVVVDNNANRGEARRLALTKDEQVAMGAHASSAEVRLCGALAVLATAAR